MKTSSAGTRVYRSRLMPYGTPYDGIYRDEPGFTKHATDTVGPFVYMEQRYYDPGTRFISPDPVGVDAGNFNRYAYARNNPYTSVDPDGREAGAAYRVMYNYEQGIYPQSMSAAEVGMVADFTPGVSDVKGFVDAYNEPSFINFTAATIGLAPVVGDVAAKTPLRP